MNQIFAGIISKVLPFCVAAALYTPAQAGDLKTSFLDIPETSPYYEAVKYFSEEEIIPGTKDGLFHPDAEMTVQDWSVILARLNGQPETGMESAENNPSAYIYSSIWQTAGITTYTAHDYGFTSKLDAGTTAMLTTGLIDRSAAGRTAISRGEALRLLYEVAVKKTVTEVPPNLIAFFDVSADCEDPEETEALLRKLLEAYPNNQLALMLAYDYRFEIWDDLSSLPVRYSDTLLGLEDDGEHIIYLEKEAVSDWTLHEVGHAVETCNCSYSATYNLNKAERAAGIKLLGEYAGVNQSEFIAEATSYFMKNQSNQEAINAMKESMPLTYEYLSKLVVKEPFLRESYFFDIVSPEV